MTSKLQTLIVAGASGDLAERLLLPGLASLLERDRERDGGRRVRLIGTSRHAWDDGAWDGLLERASENAGLAKGRLRELLEHDEPRTADPAKPDDLRELLDAVEGEPVLYLALPPGATERILDALLEVGVPDDLRIVAEKPFGDSLESARHLNEHILKVVPEERVFRVDHFLGMGPVLDVLSLRFGGRLLEQVWNAEHVERVEIVDDESIALEGRADFYDKTGALADMHQSHLLQVLGLVAMERPERLDADGLRDAVIAALDATWFPNDDPAAASRRGRYTAGTSNDRDIPSYADEDGVDASRGTETLVELELEVRTDRWKGVPFVLRSGKGIGSPSRHIDLLLRAPEPLEGLEPAPAGRIRIDLGVRGGIHASTALHGDPDPFAGEAARLEVDSGRDPLLPYGQVLVSALDGDLRLSVRGDAAERCWAIVEPVLAAFRADEVALQEYPAGSDGFEDSLVTTA